MKHFRNILVLLLLLLSGGEAFAQFNLNKFNGLPSDHVYMFLKDQYGYLWIATDRGVLRYNGYEFKTFNTSQELGSSDVWRIYRDRLGRIWLFSYSKSFGYIHNNKYHKVVAREEVINPGGEIYESESCLLFPIQKQVVASGVADSNYILYRELYPVGKPENAKPLYMLERNMASDHMNLFAFDGRTFAHKRKFTSTAGKITPYHYGYRLAIYRKHAFFYLRKKHSLIHLDLEKDKCREIIGDYSAKEFSYLQHPEYAETGLRDYIYLFYAGQVNKLDSALRVTHTFPVTEITKPGVSGYDLVYLLEDSLWGRCVATESYGGFISPALRNAFKPASWSATGFSFVSATNDSTSFWWNEQTRTLARFGKDGSVFRKRYEQLPIVSAVLPFDQQHDALFLQGYYYLMNKRTGQLGPRLPISKDTTGLMSASGLPHHYILSNRELYSCVLSVSSGLRSDLLKGKFKEVVNDPARSGHWVYNHHTLYFINRKDSCHPMNHLLKKLGIAQLEKLLADPYGNLLLLSPDKLLQYDPSTGSVSELLSHCNLSDVKLAFSGNLLVAAGRFGVAFLRTRAPGIYDVPFLYHNIKDNHYLFVKNLLVQNHRVLIETDKGAYGLMIPDAAPHLRNDLPYYFLVQYNDSMYTGPAYRVAIDQHKNAVQFDLVRPSGNGMLTYRYRLEGLDSNWKELNANELVLPRLKAGQAYTLSLMATDAVWKSPLMQVELYVIPFWWQSAPGVQLIWFGALLLAGGIIFFTVLIVRNFIEKRQKQLLELELKAIYAQINPHFIFNTLNSGLHFIKKQRTDEAYHHILRFSQLLRAYLKASRHRYITLAEEVKNLSMYIELQQTRFGNMFEYTIELNNIQNPEEIGIPSLLLQPIVENAIEHGLLPKERAGHLAIGFHLDPGKRQLTCTVSDDGIGRTRSRLAKPAGAAKNESYGNDLVKELILLFNKYEKMGIEIAYHDLPEPSTGTVVSIIIKNPRLPYE